MEVHSFKVNGAASRLASKLKPLYLRLAAISKCFHIRAAYALTLMVKYQAAFQAMSLAAFRVFSCRITFIFDYEGFTRVRRSTAVTQDAVLHSLRSNCSSDLMQCPRRHMSLFGQLYRRNVLQDMLHGMYYIFRQHQ